MPDLGAYAFYVLTAYGVSLGLIIALCLLSVSRAKAIRAALEDVETRARNSG
ncbi:heme exporter protein CcmD [Primorskyibacter sp. S187A]|uniref:heme exporter protein CcmD n=1 Tax=Primorskyibacter sp. S187A TaxID=3415130 RepID=UPI003C7A0ECC